VLKATQVSSRFLKSFGSPAIQKVLSTSGPSAQENRSSASVLEVDAETQNQSTNINLLKGSKKLLLLFYKKYQILALRI